MKTINDFKFKVKDGEVITDNKVELIGFIEENSIEGVGFGQQFHSLPGTPAVGVFKMTKENYIAYDDGFMCEGVTIYYTSNDMYITESFDGAVRIEEDFNPFGRKYNLKSNQMNSISKRCQIKTQIKELQVVLHSRYGAYGHIEPSLEKQKEMHDRITELREQLKNTQ